MGGKGLIWDLEHLVFILLPTEVHGPRVRAAEKPKWRWPRSRPPALLAMDGWEHHMREALPRLVRQHVFDWDAVARELTAMGG